MKRTVVPFIVASLCGHSLLAGEGLQASTGEFPITIRIDAGKTKGELRPVWRFFGYSEPNYTYMHDGRKLLSEIAELGGSAPFIRTRHLFTSGDGTPAFMWGSTNVYSEDAQGTPRYDWTIL